MNPYGQNPKSGPQVQQPPQQPRKECCGIAEFKDTLSRHAEAPSREAEETNVDSINSDYGEALAENLTATLSSLMAFSISFSKFVVMLPFKIILGGYRFFFIRLPMVRAKRKRKKRYARG
ncbi:MAG: hypothetical protein ACQEP8_01505 [Chlamydiota bacterium]